MKYTYIALLVMVLFGMFYFGGRNQSSELSYQNASSVKDLPSTYTKRDYCAPEIDTETSGYKLELSAAQKKIAELEKQLEEAKLSGTPTPSPSVTGTPTPAKLSPTPTPIKSGPTSTEADEPETGVSPASSSANN